MKIRNICTIPLELTWTTEELQWLLQKTVIPKLFFKAGSPAGDLSLPNGLSLPLAPREVYRKLQRKSLRITELKEVLRVLTHSF